MAMDVDTSVVMENQQHQTVSNVDLLRKNAEEEENTKNEHRVEEQMRAREQLKADKERKAAEQRQADEARRMEEERSFIERYKAEERKKWRETAGVQPEAWNAARALQRYHEQADDFDRLQFTRQNPLTFYSVPWPILDHPNTSGVSHVTADAVKSFFRALRKSEGKDKYLKELQIARVLFHPDRWLSRKRYAAIADPQMASSMANAVLQVSQAVGNLMALAKK
jgi:hypothetical protein